jgi:hypothetical protein
MLQKTHTGKSFLVACITCLLTPLFSQVTSSGWVSVIGGTGWEFVPDIKTDENGNIYTIGSFSGTADFDGSAATVNRTAAGDRDAFVTKHTPDGQFVWVATFGGTGTDLGNGVDVDPSGDVYVVGSFEATADVDPGAGTQTLTSAGQEDMFIAKLNDSGALVWAKRIGGTSVDEANDVAVDQDGNLYIVGRFDGTVDFNPGTATANLSGSSADGFVLKLESDGDYVWAYDIGSGNSDRAEAVVVDGTNNVIIAGDFDGNPDFDPGPGQHNVSSNGDSDPFYLKLTPGGLFVWVTTFGVAGNVANRDVDVDKDNNIVTHGFFTESINPEPGNSATVIPAIAAEDAYTAKINQDGSVAWLHTLGGESLEWGYGVAVDALGDVYVTGFYYNSPDFDPGDDEFLMPSAGLEDTYIVKYSSTGDFIWAKRTGGTGGDSGYGIDINATGDVLVTGNFYDKSDLDPEPAGTLNITSKGSSDIFILHIEQTITSTADASTFTADWKLCPNPSSGLLTLAGNEDFPVTVSIMDMTGSRLPDQYLLQSASQSIDLQHLPAGMYFIDVRSDEARAVMKWIKI